VPAPYHPSDWLDALGVALREARRRAGLSQEALGHKVRRPWRESVHRTYISEIERGLRNPSVRILIELVNELDGDIVALFKRADELLATAKTGPANRPPDPNRVPLHYG
jgi:transcriptional regulator with XRE-family HTH domain